MQRILSFILIYGVCALPVFSQETRTPNTAVTHISTALNHLSVLEFAEPVTLAAAGSADFQIERQGTLVFIKPVKADARTDLFVWTGTRRFAYELETTTEVKNMNFAIDNSAPAPAPPVSTGTDELADMMLTRAFLGAQQIRNVRTRADQVNVRIEQIFRTRTTVYVHYTIENSTDTGFHIDSPAVFQLDVGHSAIPLGSLARTQLDARERKKLGATEAHSLPIAHAETEAHDLQPGASTQGVVAIRQDLKSPAVVELVFDGQVKATFVL